MGARLLKSLHELSFFFVSLEWMKKIAPLIHPIPQELQPFWVPKRRKMSSIRRSSLDPTRVRKPVPPEHGCGLSRP